jgi:hypothetical protein
MRKIQYNQITETISALIEACHELPCLETSARTALLSDMRRCVENMAIFVVNVAHKHENIGMIIDIFNRLNELILSVIDGQADTLHILPVLEEIDGIVKTTLKPDSFEIAFLSYNASMADSLYSIYQAAKDDPCCEAYFIPIPYFGIGENKTYENICFDGKECYPDIECTDWKTYDIEERHPDVIFSFAPYDDENYFTSVPSQFFFKNLHKHTDLLCYVPYFIVIKDRIDEHFARLPGVIYADRVFLETENIKEQYIRYYEKFLKKNPTYTENRDLNMKFVSSGSPKLDNIKVQTEIPETWLKKIGSKKVFLYNTTITGILDSDDGYMTKIAEVIEIFSKREDCVLLWRPHPLSVETIRSSRPKLLKAYEEIVADFKKRDFGIFDDTPDLDRALKICGGGYIGDKSSVIPMYKKIHGDGACLLQKPYLLTENDRIPIHIGCLVEVGDEFWFTSINANALFKSDKLFKNIVFVGMFPGEKVFGSLLYLRSVVFDNKICFVPARAREIAVYDIAERKFTKIKILEETKKSGHFTDDTFKFHTAFYHDSRIYFPSLHYPDIMILNTKTYELTRYTGIADELYLYDITKTEIKSCRAYLNDNMLVIVYFNNNIVAFYDLVNNTHTIKHIGSNENNYNDVCFDGHDYWFTPNSSLNVVRYNPATGKCVEISLEKFTSSRTGDKFEAIVFDGTDILLFPDRADSAIKINRENNTVSLFLPINEYITDLYNSDEQFELHHFCCAAFVDETLYAYYPRKHMIISYNCDDHVFHDAKISISRLELQRWKDAKEQIIASEKCTESIENENIIYGVNDFIDNGCKNTDTAKITPSQNFETAGKRIYDNVKKSVLI